MKLKLKLPAFIKKLPTFPRGTPSSRPRVLRASARRAAPQPAFDDYPEEDEPTTRLSSAFIVVLLLHLVAIGGIFAFNGIKAHRRSQEVMNGPGTAAPAKPAAPAISDSALVATATPTPAPFVRPQTTAPVPISGAKVHHVKAGETLVKVALAYNVTPLELANANSLKETSILHAGQTLNIPASSHIASTAAKPVISTSANLQDQQKLKFLLAQRADGGAGKTYTVGKGESLYAIARKLSVSSDDLMKANKIDDPKKLQIGQVLKVPAKAPKPSTESAG